MSLPYRLGSKSLFTCINEGSIEPKRVGLSDQLLEHLGSNLWELIELLRKNNDSSV